MVDTPNLEELDAAQQGLPGADAPALGADTRAALIAQLLSGRADAEAILAAASAAVAAAPPTPVASTPATVPVADPANPAYEPATAKSL